LPPQAFQARKRAAYLLAVEEGSVMIQTKSSVSSPQAGGLPVSPGTEENAQEYLDEFQARKRVAYLLAMRLLELVIEFLACFKPASGWPTC